MIMKGTNCFFNLLVVVLLLSSSGCTFDFDEFTSQTDGDALVTFSIQLPDAKSPATRALDDADEDEVAAIDVLVFKPSGGNYAYSVRCNSSDINTDPGDSRKKTFTVKLQQGNFDLVIVANARSILTGTSLKGMTKYAVLSALTTQMPTGSKWITDKSSADYTAILMWGDIGDRTINASTDLTGGNAIPLTRMVAKVDVKVDDAVNNFTLTSVHVFNYNTHGAVVPANSAWDASSKIAIAPTVPSASTLTKGPLDYNNDSGKTEINTVTNSCEGEIYLFESENHTGTGHTSGKSLLDRTCIVVGGVYDTDSSPTYYRVDFSNGSGISQTFLDVLRNHQYIFKITRVSGPGFSTPEIAFESGPVNIEANVLEWNQAGMPNAEFDGQNILKASQNQYYFSRDEKKTENEDNVLYVMTDYTTTVSGAQSGWHVDKIVDAADGTTPVTWINLSSDMGAANYDTKTILMLDENNTAAVRRAIIWIAAGRLRYAVNVTQDYIAWARSNVVWNGSKLTFATTPEENKSIPANSQGVFFKWGSLVAISPAALTGTTTAYTAGKYPSGHILFSPTGIYTYAWGVIPYINELGGVFGSYVLEEDDFATYNGNTGFNATDGKGDICRYISARGWVSGTWRLPTAAECQLIVAQPSIRNNGGFKIITVTPDGVTDSSGKGLNAYGYYQHLSGRWLGACTSSSATSPSVGVYFPAGGHREGGGNARNAGNMGYSWSGSSGTWNTTVNSRLLFVGSGAWPYMGELYRHLSVPVRCVRE